MEKQKKCISFLGHYGCILIIAFFGINAASTFTGEFLKLDDMQRTFLMTWNSGVKVRNNCMGASSNTNVRIASLKDFLCNFTTFPTRCRKKFSHHFRILKTFHQELDKRLNMAGHFKPLLYRTIEVVFRYIVLSILYGVNTWKIWFELLGEYRCSAMKHFHW